MCQLSLQSMIIVSVAPGFTLLSDGLDLALCKLSVCRRAVGPVAAVFRLYQEIRAWHFETLFCIPL